jgi:hypothetical protein
MVKSLETITAKIFLGLREGYSEKVHTMDEVKDFLQEYVNRVGLCVTVTPTTFIYKDGREEGAVIGLINYPRFPTTKKKLKQTAEEIAKLCKERYKQNRISIEYQDQTVMLE